MSENQQISNSSDWFAAAIEDEETSRLSGVVFFLICATAIFATLAFGGVDAWAFGLLAIFTFAITAFWLADAWLKKEFHFSSTPIQIPLLGLILIGVVQLLPLRSANVPSDLLSVPATASLSIAPYSTRLAVAQLVVYFVFFAASLVFISNHKRLQKTVFIIIVFGSLLAFFGILQRLAGADAIYGLRLSPQALPFASFINQHHFAAFMEMTIGITIALIFGKATKKDKQILLLIAAVVMGIAVLLTGSRGGLISLLGVIGFVVTINLFGKTKNGGSNSESSEKNMRRKFGLIAGALALLLILFGAVLLLGGDQALLRGTGFEAGQSDFSTGRSHFWQIALKVFFEYPIFGSGLDSFGSVYTAFDSWNGAMRVEQAHNDYLQILAETGILGFSCVAAFIYLIFRKSLKIISSTIVSFRRHAAIGASAGCFGILIHSFFDFPLRTPANAFFFLILIVIATAQIYYPSTVEKARRS